jgi:hypothetical protein
LILWSRPRRAGSGVGRVGILMSSLTRVIAWLNANAGAIQAVTAIVVAVFTFQLTRTSSRQWSASKISADAAALTAKAAIRIELPILRVGAPDLIGVSKAPPERGPWGGVVNDYAPSELSAISSITLWNGGRTMCQLNSMRIGCYAGAALPTAPSYSFTVPAREMTVIPADAKAEIGVAPFCIDLSKELIKEISTEAAGLWLFGAIDYRDFLGDAHSVRFCFRRWQPEQTGIHYFEHDLTAPQSYFTR